MAKLKEILSILKQITQSKKIPFTAYNLTGKYKSPVLRMLFDLSILDRGKRWRSSYNYNITPFGKEILQILIEFPEILKILSVLKKIADSGTSTYKKAPHSIIPKKIWKNFMIVNKPSILLENDIQMKLLKLFSYPFADYSNQMFLYISALTKFYLPEDLWKIFTNNASFSFITEDYLNFLHQRKYSKSEVEDIKTSSVSNISFEGDRKTHQSQYYITISYPNLNVPSGKYLKKLPSWMKN